MAGACSPNLQPSPLSISVEMICQGGKTEGKFIRVRDEGYEQDGKRLPSSVGMQDHGRPVVLQKRLG